MVNIEVFRFYGYAKVHASMQSMLLQQNEPDDFVIDTGLQYNLLQFIEWRAAKLDVKLNWRG